MNPSADATPLPGARSYIARFSLELPPGFRLSTLEAAILNTELERREPLVDSSPGSLDTAWRARLQEIARVEDYNRKTGTILEERTLIPNRFLAARYLSRPGVIERWTGVVQTTRERVWWGIDTAPENRDRALKKLSDVGSAWRSPSDEAPFPFPPGTTFYLLDGAVMLPVQLMEHCRAVWRGPAPNSRVEFYLRRPSTQEPRGVGDRFMDMLGVLSASLSSRLDRLRAGTRWAGGQPGEELVMTFEEHGRREFSATWLRQGPGPDQVPYVLRLTFEARLGDASALLAEWDRILSVFRPV